MASPTWAKTVTGARSLRSVKVLIAWAVTVAVPSSVVIGSARLILLLPEVCICTWAGTTMRGVKLSELLMTLKERGGDAPEPKGNKSVVLGISEAEVWGTNIPLITLTTKLSLVVKEA